MTIEHQKTTSFATSLFTAFIGLGLLGSVIFLSAKDNFLALLLMQGGSFKSYVYALLLAIGLILGIALIARHLAKEGVAENFYEHTPY